MTRPNVSRKAQRLLDRFDESARHWGWAEDLGYGPSVDASRKVYEADRRALFNYIARLERKETD